MEQSAGVGVWLFDMEGVTTFMNARMAGMLGLDPRESVGTRLAEFVDDEARPAIAIVHRATIGVPFEHAFRRRDGSIRCGLFESSPLRGAAFHEGGVLCIVTDMTDEKNAREARQEADLLFSSLFESGIVGILTSNASGEVLQANDAFLRLVGHTREDLDAGRIDFTALTPHEYRATKIAALEQLRVTGTAPSWEKEYVRKDGRRIPVLVAVAALGGERFLSLVVDLTERKRAEALRMAVVDAALDAIVGMDHTGRITEWNPAAEAIFGHARADVFGRSLAEVLIPERWREAHTTGLQRYLTTGEGSLIGRRIEVNALRSDGTEVPVELAFRTIGFDSPPMFIGFVRDLTQKKETERALHIRTKLAELAGEVGFALAQSADLPSALKRCAEAIVAQLGGAFARIWTLDRLANVLVLQASAGMYTHVDGGHARVPVGSGNIGLIASEGRAHVSNDVANDPRTFDPAWATCEGLVAFAGYPLMVGGEVVGVLAMFTREPLREATCKGLAAIADAIAIGVHRNFVKAAHQRLEVQLRQSQKMEAVGRLAGGIAHDFNNMLCVILSYCDLILDDLKSTDPLRTDLEEIRKAGGRAANLTRQLLMFSRQNVMTPRLLDLHALLADMNKMLERLVGEDIDMVLVNRSAALGSVLVDPGGIEQVLVNLVVNARDAMPTGGKVTIETANVVLDEGYTRQHAGAKPGPHVMLAVTDTGVGIPPDVQTRIFEPFFTTKEVGRGTGLGLSTVLGIVQQNGGSIWVYSELERGTCFKVYFPQAVGLHGGVSAPRPSLAAARGNETILLIEDAESVRTVARDILQRQGYEVLVASSGAEGLALAEKHHGTIDLLVTDVVMPGFSGPELAKRLAQVRPALKVLCMSGYTDDSIVRHGVLTAELAYLQKPFTPSSLTAKVREVLSGVSAAGS